MCQNVVSGKVSQVTFQVLLLADNIVVKQLLKDTSNSGTKNLKQMHNYTEFVKVIYQVQVNFKLTSMISILKILFFVLLFLII